MRIEVVTTLWRLESWNSSTTTRRPSAAAASDGYRHHQTGAGSFSTGDRVGHRSLIDSGAVAAVLCRSGLVILEADAYRVDFRLFITRPAGETGDH